MRQVKCRDTNEYKPQNEAFKDPDKGYYYSSKKAWEKIKENNNYKNKCYDFIMDILGLQKGQKVPSGFLKKLNELSGYGYAVVYETLLRNEKAIRWALANKEFNSDYHAASYVFAIVGNNIRSVAQEFKKKEVVQHKMDKDEDISYQELSTVPQKVSDISKFVGDIDD